MIASYLKSSLRTLGRSPSYTVINIASLALGITCAVLIFSMVAYHLQFDTFHENGDRIYRFVTEEEMDVVDHSPSVPPAFGKAFRDDYTFGEVTARYCLVDVGLVSFEHNGNHSKHNEALSFADATYFDIFNFPLLTGTNELAVPKTAIVTERIAKKWFGDDSAVGKTIRFDNNIDFRITGVLKDLPDKTDLRSEIFLSYLNLNSFSEWYARDDAWGGITSSIQTFTRLREGVDPRMVENEVAGYVAKFRPKSKNVHHYKLQPLSDMHFNQDYEGRIATTTLAVLAVIGFFLILTAALNFINLATAQSLTRSREVGVRKVLGSARRQLFWQFTMETLVLVCIAFVLSFCVAYAVVPTMNSVLDTRISIDLLDYRLLLFSLALILLVTFMAGAYPGILLSGFKPVTALKGQVGAGQGGGFNTRRLLITSQFIISQVLLIGLIVVLSQMSYFRNANLGFNKDGVVLIPVGSRDEKSKTLKEQFLALPYVENVSMCFSAPASPVFGWGTAIRFDQRPELEDFACGFKGGDADYVETFGLRIVTGRNLLPSDTVREYLVNETMVHKLGETTESVLGKNIFFNGQYNGPVVGVVADFHDASLHNEINPVFITSQLDFHNTYAVKINLARATETLGSLENAWSTMYPDQIFDSEFLDDHTAEFYRAEEMMLNAVQIFAFIALLIGCLGLYGLVSFMAVRRQKEIGIRKALGGTVMHILWLFGREFSRLVLLAFLIAAPASWFIMRAWLDNFEYKIDLGPWIFLVNLVVIFIVVAVTVSFRSTRAALMNPVLSLRAE
jgi:putative ABC transport system permease protein